METNKHCALKLIHDAQRSGCRKQVACEALGINIRTVQRWECANSLFDQRKGPLTSPKHRLSERERKEVLAIANSKDYADLPPCQIVPRLADQGIYLASESSFYRILKAANQLHRRSRQRKPTHQKPRAHLATHPNEVWSWDISYLPTNVAGLFYYLYFFIDIYSRKIVGYAVHGTESAEHANELIRQIYVAERIRPHQVSLHSDNGSPMKATTLKATLRQLGITPSYSRPSVSNDNPFSEALFKTTKYCRHYPLKPFATLEEARKWVINFVHWYNDYHLHSGLKFITPQARHSGLDQAIVQHRTDVYEQAKKRNPQRWSKHIRNWKLPTTVSLNPTIQIISRQ